MSSITLKSNDGAEIAISLKIANVSRTLGTKIQSLNMTFECENASNNNGTKAQPTNFIFLLTMVNEPILKLIVAWCEYHCDDSQDTAITMSDKSRVENKPLRRRVTRATSDLAKLGRTLRSKLRSDGCSTGGNDARKVEDKKRGNDKEVPQDTIVLRSNKRLRAIEPNDVKSPPKKRARKSLNTEDSTNTIESEAAPKVDRGERESDKPRLLLDDENVIKVRCSPRFSRMGHRNGEFEAFTSTLNRDRSVCQWDLELFKYLDVSSLCELGRAAVHLEIKGLIEVTIKIIQQRFIDQYTHEQLFKAYKLMVKQNKISQSLNQRIQPELKFSKAKNVIWDDNVSVK